MTNHKPGPGHRVLVFSLDLIILIWTCHIPSGVPPSPLSPCPGSWVHKAKIYTFASNHLCKNLISSHLTKNKGYLLCYDVENNSWEWPEQEGDDPSPGHNYLAIISEDSVFLFGEKTSHHGGKSPMMARTSNNDLHILDMLTLRWKRVHDATSSQKVPKFKGYQTLTRISTSG